MGIGRRKSKFRRLVDGNDPLHQVNGRKPTQSLPWHINVCRQRIRDGVVEHSAFSPTGQKGFHVPMKFAHFHSGRSFKFDADESVTDYVIANTRAEQLYRKRKYTEAFDAFLSLAEFSGATEFQKSMAIAGAADCAIAMKEFEQIEQLSERASIDSVEKTIQMKGLAAQREWPQILQSFGDEDLSAWPFWQIGQAAAIRGTANFFAKLPKKADADFVMSLEYEPDAKIQCNTRTLMATNREVQLGDSAGALKLYQANLEGKTRIGGADEFRSLARASAILSKVGKGDEAIGLFKLVDFDRLQGHWLHEMLLAKGSTLAELGKFAEAQELFRKVRDSDSATKPQRDLAEASLKERN